MARYDNILDTVGKTPVVKIGKLVPPGVNLYVKLEARNPMGSVKDRLALGVIEAAERSGALQPGQTVIEATSGNTGIGLAMVCAQKGIAYRTIDLDSVEYQPENRGGRIRAALAARTKMGTIPQVFVGGALVGGATETFDAYRAGKLQDLLATSGVTYDTTVKVDPYSFLPTWLHPR